MSRFVTWYRVLLLAPGILPLIYWDGVMYPLMAPKTLLLRGAGVLVAAGFVYLVACGQPLYWQRLRSWYAAIPAALLAVAYASSLVGTDFFRSFWSTFERGDGLLTLTVCVLYFYAILLHADQRFFRSFCKVVAWVGSIAGAYVIIQWLAVSAGVDFSPLLAKVSGRVGGTMGNAAFLAAYLGLSLFITLGVVKNEVKKRKLFYIGAALQLIGILLTATRGTILALILTSLGVLVYQSVRGEGQWKNRARQWGAGVLVVMALFVIFRDQLANVPIESVRRLASISLTDGTVGSRLFLWQNLLPLAFEKPILGVGAEHIAPLFDRIYDPTKIFEQWFDRSHNAYLDYLIQFGVIGLALYLALIVTGVLFCYRIMQSKTHPFVAYAPYFLLAFLVYALQNFFVFDTGVTLWTLLALLAVVVAQTSTSEMGVLLAPSTGMKWMGGVVAAAVLIFIVPVTIQPYRANARAFEAYLYQVVDVARTNEATAKGLALNTYADLEFGYNAYFMYTEEQRVRLAGEKLVQAYENALRVLSANRERYPYDARTAVYLAHVLDAAPAGARVDREFEREVLTSAIALSPKRAQPWYILANLSISAAAAEPQGAKKNALYEEASSILTSYATLVPNIAEPHYVLADLYLARGNKPQALKEAEKGKLLYVPHLATAKRAAIFYEKIEDWKNAEFFLASVVAEDADADTWHYDLAKAKYLNADFAGAVEIVKYLRAKNPAILETDPAFLAAITPYER